MAAKSNTAKHDNILGTHTGRFQFLLDSGMYSDVQLIVGKEKERVKAHKLILMTGSPHFKKMLSVDTSTTELSFPDVQFDIFWRFLKFLYTGEMCKEVRYAIPLLNIAKNFKVPDLEAFCLQFVRENLQTDNALEILGQALEYKLQDLVAAATKLACRYASDIVDSTNFTGLSIDCLKELVKSDDLAIDNEVQLFESLIRWSEAECKRQGTIITPKYCRSVLDPLIPYIRFPLIDPAYFSLKVAPRNILTTEEMVSVLLYYNIPMDQRINSPPGLFNSSPRKYNLATTTEAAKTGRTSILLSVNCPPYPTTTIEAGLRCIIMDGLTWGEKQIGGSQNELRIKCILEDKVSIETLTAQIKKIRAFPVLVIDTQKI